MTTRTTSISRQVIALVLSMGLPALALIAFSIHSSGRAARRDADEASLRVAQHAAGNLRSLMAEADSVVRQVSRLQARPGLDPRHRAALLEGFASHHPLFGSLVLTDPDGGVLPGAVTTAMRPNGSPEAAECLRNVRTTDRVTVSAPFTDRLTHHRVVLVAGPVRDARGHHFASVALTIDIEELRAELSRIARPRGGTVTLLDGAGAILLRVPPRPGSEERLAAGTEAVALAPGETTGTRKARDLDGVERVFGFAAVPGTPWRVCAGSTIPLGLAWFRWPESLLGLLGLCLLSLGAAFAVAIGRSIQRPMRALRSSIEAAAEGRRDARATPAGVDEIADVAAQLDRWIDAEDRFAETQRELLARAEAAQRDADAAREVSEGILERVSDGFVALDRDWRYTYVNEKAAELMNRKGEDLIGKHIWTEFPEGVGEEFYKAYHRAVELQVPIELEEYYPPWDRWFENRIYPSPEGLTIFFHEITERKRMEQAQRESAIRLQLAVQAGNVGLWSWDLRTNLVYFSPEWKAQLGFREHEVSDRFDEWESRLHPDDRPRAKAAVAAFLEAPTSEFESEFRMRHRDGTYRWILARGGVSRDESGQPVRMLGCHIDFTERKRLEEESRRANRALAALNGCHQALIGAASERELLDAICRVIVGQGGYRMAWVGWADEDDARTVRPVARAGFEEGYLGTVKISWADDEFGQGPTGTAIRTRRIVESRHIPSDPSFSQWREEAVKRGYGASLACPLLAGDQCLGALNIYAAEPAPFDPAEMELLGQLAGDLAYGITALRTRTARGHAEQALRERTLQLEMAVEGAGLVVWHWDRRSGRITSLHEGMPNSGLAPGGYPHTEEEFRARIDPADLGAVTEQIRRAVEGDGEYRAEYRIRVPGEAVRWVSSRGRCVRDADGNPLSLTGVEMDITERKEREALLSTQSRILERIAGGAPLTEGLTALVHAIEAQYPGMLGSVLLASPDGVHLSHGAAPSLPAEFTRAIDGEPIGERAGSCGTAAFRGETVIVEDIEHDPLWADYRELALRHGLRACWSTPIMDAQRHVLGTFAIYFHQPARPTPAHLQLIEVAAHLASIAIGRERGEVALRASEEQFRTAFDHAAVGMCLTGLDGRLVRVNERLCEMLGRSRSELTGQHFQSISHPDDLALGEEAVRQLRSNPSKGVGIEKRYIHRDGHPIWAHVVSAPVRDPEGRLVQFITQIEDVTERKEAEARERHLHDRLHRAETMSALGTLVAGVAHEVRNPLFAISSTLDALEVRFGARADHERYVKVLREEADRLNGLMRDLLEYGRPREPHFAHVPLRPLVAEVVRACEPLSNERAIRIENRVPGDLPALYADHDLLFIALKNVIENAVLHSSRAGSVTLTANVASDGEVPWVRCDVLDSGPGFEPCDLPRIFEPFFSRRTGGTGLGLSIVQRIVEEHGGEVVAATRPVGGAAVTLKLKASSG